MCATREESHCKIEGVMQAAYLLKGHGSAGLSKSNHEESVFSAVALVDCNLDVDFAILPNLHAVVKHRSLLGNWFHSDEILRDVS